MKKIVCVHLLNDFSGSPLVLSQVIEGMTKAGFEVDLFTCRSDKKGFLSPGTPANPAIHYHYFPYRYFNNKYITLITFMFSQLLLFFKLLRYRNTDALFYINTLLPFGAALAGKVLGKKVIYHVHETSLNPPAFKKLLRLVASRTAEKGVFVSHYLLEQESLPGVENTVIYNALPRHFAAAADRFTYRVGRFTALMACSLKDYKGVKEFVLVAAMLPALHFELVLNASQHDIDRYFSELPVPPNLSVFPSQSEMKPFYERASVVLNLSHPNRWIETFGMTLLEAMRYGIPVIAPSVGGPVELVQEGVNGFLVDGRDTAAVSERLRLLASDEQLCMDMSRRGRELARRFDLDRMQNQVNALLE